MVSEQDLEPALEQFAAAQRAHPEAGQGPRIRTTVLNCDRVGCDPDACHGASGALAGSGVVLGLEGPFRIGDWVEVESLGRGRVIEIGWRTTRLLTRDFTYVILPNSQVFRQRIVNYSARQVRFSGPGWSWFWITPFPQPKGLRYCRMHFCMRH
ncbi:mechanosensitive ion channel family protein [Paracoccus benzoatiresistens]|uniref:Mechanosensitive ion channel n=1 Tax=Paracoccus benzoatiresistens TaxID=2997341 RepID=A0ABT4JCE8_9RHOB|nr:mechanosensitive ion channel domain-containing protein [Paracoccus sp. EF6]MCZ0964400.1 mechanosensitive ion channel [Paracoccus sp. EF6]